MGKFASADAIDQLFALAAILDELLDRDDLQVVPPRQLVKLVGGRALPAVGQDFAEHAGGQQASHAGQIDGRFGVSGAAQHAAFLGHQRKHVAGPKEVVRLALRVDQRQDRGRPLGGGDARADRAMIDRHGEVRPQRGRIVPHHGVKIEPLADLRQDRHAELPAAVEHEIDDFGRDLLGRTDEVAFVFAVFGVDDDDDLAATNRLDRRFDARKPFRHARLD